MHSTLYGFGETACNFWDGSNLSTPFGGDTPVELNNQNYVIGTSSNGAFLWTPSSVSPVNNGVTPGTEQLISQLIPTQHNSENISNISPIDISGTSANGGIGLLFTAQFTPAPNAASTSGTFLLTLESGTTPNTLQQVSLPSNISNLQFNGLNAQGLIADIGNITTGTGNAAVTGTNHALLLLPVDITVWRTADGGPPDGPPPNNGVVVTNGDTLTICLTGIAAANLPLPPGQPVWKISQLQSNGQYSSTWQQTGTGIEFNYAAPTSGIFELKAVLFGDDADAPMYLRKHDDTISGQKVGWGKAGQPDAFGVVDNAIQIAIRLSAAINLGSDAYDPGTNHPPSFPPGQNKCNLFVADKCNDAGATVPWSGNPLKPHPPSANQWAGIIQPNIPNWTLLPATTTPQPGFVVADPNSLGSGHCGILDYDGWGIGAGEYYHVSKLYPFFPGSAQRQYSPASP